MSKIYVDELTKAKQDYKTKINNLKKAGALKSYMPSKVYAAHRRGYQQLPILLKILYVINKMV